MKANRVITPSAPAISDCSQELSRRINPVTASPNAVSKPAKRNRTNARGPCSPGFGRPANAKQACGVTRLLWVRAAVGPAPTERPELGARCRRPGKSAGFRSTLESGIRSAVIIPMRQQPGPMLIFRLTEDRRSRLDVGRNGGNPRSVPGAPVIPLRRHHEQLKNTCADAAPPWEPATCRTPPLRQQLWLWLDAVVAWLVTDYVWEAADTIPACWRQHPHLVHEIAVLADQRRRAGHAFTNGLGGMASLQSACVDRTDDLSAAELL
jgi:hypothetical protein